MTGEAFLNLRYSRGWVLASGRNAFVLVAVNKLIGRGFCFLASPRHLLRELTEILSSGGGKEDSLIKRKTHSESEGSSWEVEEEEEELPVWNTIQSCSLPGHHSRESDSLKG